MNTKSAGNGSVTMGQSLKDQTASSKHEASVISLASKWRNAIGEYSFPVTTPAESPSSFRQLTRETIAVWAAALCNYVKPAGYGSSL